MYRDYLSRTPPKKRLPVILIGSFLSDGIADILADRYLDLLSFFFFVNKIPLSRRVEYVMDGSMDESASHESASQ